MLAYHLAPRNIVLLCMTLPFGGGVEGESNDRNKPMARTASGGVERHLSYAPHVDPDRRQDPARTYAATKSLVECYSVCHA